jgi:hypothetical protein
MTFDEENGVSRRRMIGVLGASLASSAALTTNAAGDTHSAPLADPTTRFPKPPFNKQSQPWPGLVSQMDPRPDHGESSYGGPGASPDEKR